MTMLPVFLVCVLCQTEGPLAAAAAWEHRYRELGAVEIVATGQVVTTPDFLTGFGVRKGKLEDKPLPIHLHAKLDFANQRIWIRRDEFVWDAPDEVFVRTITEATILPSGAVVRKIDPKTGAMISKRFYRGAAALSQTARLDVQPLWINSGIVTLDDRTASLFDFPDYDAIRKKRAWSIVPDDTEKSQGILEIAVSSLVPSGLGYTLQVDSHRRYIVQAVVARKAEQPITSEIRMSYQDRDGLPVIDGWRTTAYGNGKLLIHEDIKVTRFERNCEFPESAFAAEDDG
jgi:hypothetical protein